MENICFPNVNIFGKMTMSLYILLTLFTSIPSFKAFAILTFISVKMFPKKTFVSYNCVSMEVKDS